MMKGSSGRKSFEPVYLHKWRAKLQQHSTEQIESSKQVRGENIEYEAKLRESMLSAASG